MFPQEAYDKNSGLWSSGSFVYFVRIASEFSKIFTESKDADGHTYTTLIPGQEFFEGEDLAVAKISDSNLTRLDTKSEGIVQEALDRAAKSRTTIVIAIDCQPLKMLIRSLSCLEAKLLKLVVTVNLLNKLALISD